MLVVPVCHCATSKTIRDSDRAKIGGILYQAAVISMKYILIVFG